MSRTKTSIRVAGGALLLILGSGTLLFLSRSGEPQEMTEIPTAPMQIADSGVVPLSSGLAQVRATGTDRQAVAAQPPEQQADADSQTASLHEDGSGSLTGSLSQVGRGFLPKRTVTFVRGEDLFRDKSINVTTDEHGMFYVDRLPVGTWHAFFHAEQAADRAAATRCGTVEILEGRPSALDIVIETNRVVKGAFTLADDPEAMLQLELHTKWGLPRVVASGWAVPAEDPGTFDGIPPGDAERERHVPPPGFFEFSGVPADQYVLRVVLGQSDRRGLLYIERDVDLSQGDVILPAEEVSLSAADVRSQKD